jgi:hypothetical protein
MPALFLLNLLKIEELIYYSRSLKKEVEPMNDRLQNLHHLHLLRRLPSRLPDPAKLPEREYLLVSDLIYLLERMQTRDASVTEFHQCIRRYIRETPVLPFSFHTSPDVPNQWLHG